MEPSGNKRGTATGVLLAVSFAALLGTAGCGRESQDVRGARLAAERYLDALARDEVTSLRAKSTCMVPSESIVGGVVLRVEKPRTTSLATLDSLARSASATHRTLDSLWVLVPEATTDSLFLRSRLFARRHLLYRNALRAASLSLDGETPPVGAKIRTCRIRARIRYAGALIGPKPIDRQHVLRLLAAPGGRWIVFSVHLREDDPRPEPI